MKNLNTKTILKTTLTAFLLFNISCSSSSKNKTDGVDGASGLSDEDLTLGNNGGRFAEGSNIPTAIEGTTFPDVHFDYDSSTVKSEEIDIIKNNAKMLAGDPTIRMELEGHCDKRGTAEYNLALGEERAKAVAAMMVNYGAKPEQLSTISYGEEIPLDPATSDKAYAKNRRVHFAAFRKK
ncbi:MAG: OmpA family protein [Proteobacteria bacterium]|nr:OmpA family protein [Pseudomonadota bacterium]